VGHPKLSKGGAVLDEVGWKLLEGVLREVEVDDGSGVTMEEDRENLKVATREINVLERVKGILLRLGERKKAERSVEAREAEGASGLEALTVSTDGNFGIR
jgi:hypothetical protein